MITFFNHIIVLSHIVRINKVDSCKYLGVTITNNLNWSKHIANIVSKAHSVCGFLQRNLKQCLALVKAKAYLAFLDLYIVEYASVIWSPYTTNDITALEEQCNVKLPGLLFKCDSYMMNNLK